MRSLKKRGPHVLDDLNDLLFSLHMGGIHGTPASQSDSCDLHPNSG